MKLPLPTVRVVSWVVLLSACGKAGDSGKPGAGAVSGAGSASPAAVETELAKLQPYIECLNRYSQATNRAIGDYFDDIDRERGPSKGEPSISGLSDPKDCVAGVAAAKKNKPAIPELEAAGAAFAKALVDLTPVLNEADQYYDRKNYKDDRFAKGKELHPKLLPLFEAFEKADTALAGEVRGRNRKLREQDLAAREKKSGRKMDVILDSLMFAAEDLVPFASVDWQDMAAKIDVAAMTAGIDRFEKLHAEAGAYLKAHADEVRGADRVISEAEGFLTAAKEMMRRVRDKVAWSTGDKMSLGGAGEWMVNGSPAKAMREYNEAVDAYNRL